MAYNVNEAFRQKCYSGESLYKCRLIIGEETVPIEQISSIIISSPIIDDQSEIFYIGTFISQKLTIKFKNLDGITTASGTNVELYISQYVNNAWVEVPIGKYLIEESPENYYQTATIECLDYAVKFSTNVDYSPSFVDGKTTIDNLLAWICSYYGVTLGSYPTINGNVEIGTYDSTVSGKRWISYIAEIKGCNAKIDRDGQLTLVPFRSSPATTINALASESFELGEKCEFSRVIYFDAVRNYTYGDDSGNTLYIRQDNPFIANENVVQNVYNNVCSTDINYVSDTMTNIVTINDNLPNSEAFSNYAIKGITVQEDTPTPDNPVPILTFAYFVGELLNIKIQGKNYFNKSNITNNYRLAQDGSGTPASGYYVSEYIKIKPNTTYTKNSPTEDAYHRVCFYSSNETSSFVGKSENNTFTTPSNANYLRFCGLLTEKDDTQIEVGEEATQYEDYQDQNYQIDIGSDYDPISIPDAVGDGYKCSYFAKNAQGRWQYNNNIYSTTYSGSSYEDWEAFEISSGYTAFRITKENLMLETGKGYCEYFKWVPYDELSTTDNSFSMTSSYVIFSRIKVEGNYITTVSGFKEWLSEHLAMIFVQRSSTQRTNLSDSLAAQFDYISNNATLYREASNIFLPCPAEFTYKKADSFTIYSLKTKNYGDISLDSWDIINYTLGENSYNTLNNNTITYEMTVMSEVNTKIPTKQQEVTTNVVGGTETQKMRKAQSEINNLTGEISMLTRQVETFGDSYYTIEQVNTLVQNAETGITNTFSTSGGNNIFRNTGLWFKTSTGENLFNKDRANILNASFSNNGKKLTTSANAKTLYIPCKENTKYIVTKRDGQRFRILTTDVEPAINVVGIDYLSGDGTTEINITTSASVNYLCVYYYLAGTDTETEEEVRSGIIIKEDTSNNPYEYWNGKVDELSDDKASNGRALLLKSGTLEQSQTVSNGTYTVSFKYKKLIELANVSCEINDVAYELTATTDTEFTQTIEVGSQSIKIEFITDTNDSCEIYDLMANAGETKFAYSQNQNETTTSTVNISKGISISSSDTTTTFRADADGIRTLDQSGNVLTKFTDKGMTNKEMIIENQAEIVGVLVQQVENQTWFTRM